MAKNQQRRSSSKRSRTSNNDTPSVPNDGVNNNAPQSQASSTLNSKTATLSLSNKVTMNINENAKLMQEKFKANHQRHLASAKISAQDLNGAHPIVKSAKVDKRKNPIT
eukprot:scaffold33931_cov343-Skeletonema_menzelii.AAC.1